MDKGKQRQGRNKIIWENVQELKNTSFQIEPSKISELDTDQGTSSYYFKTPETSIGFKEKKKKKKQVTVKGSVALDFSTTMDKWKTMDQCL